MRWTRLTTIVVDNGSTDGTSDAVRTAHPEAALVRSEQNTGATGGNNLGIAEALRLGADYVLLLNNDTILDPGMVEAMVAEAEARPDAGALCPLIYYHEPPDRIWYAGASFDPGKGYYRRMTGYGERDTGKHSSEVREVGALSTTAVLVPRSVLEEVGPLDDSLFVHIEDLEWSVRIRRAGYRIYCVPRARMWHKISAGSGGEHSPTIAYYATRNTLAVSERHAPLSGVRARRRRLLGVAAQLAHTRRARHPILNARAVLEGWRDFRHGRMGPRPEGGRR
jgi:GT2 family glycosyltransferase